MLIIDKKVLDCCCGGRMFWLNKQNPIAYFMDNRTYEGELCDGRYFEVKPDIVGDFRNMPFKDKSFNLVIFDPPHLIKAGEGSWLVVKYGKLDSKTYKDDIKKGFEECFRVLKDDGVLIFKWNETDIKTRDIIKLSPIPPLITQRSGKLNKTMWLVFMKTNSIN